MHEFDLTPELKQSFASSEKAHKERFAIDARAQPLLAPQNALAPKVGLAPS